MTEIQSSSSPIRRMAFATVCVATAVLSSWSALATEVPQQRTDLVNQLRALKADVLDASERESSSQMLQRNIRRRLQEANQLSTRQWQGLKTREGWDAFRITQLNALRKSLGTLPAGTAAPRTRTSGRLTGDGFEVEKLLFESRPGLWVTANLYRPIETKGQSPGILICHSHHNPKTEEELQIMGMTWAREGCFVLVMDQLGHGERRQHPFRSASDYSEDFRVGRQDYFYRYDTSLQLALIGESLMG